MRPSPLPALVVLLCACPEAPTPGRDSGDAAPPLDAATLRLDGECPMADDFGGFVLVEDGSDTWVEGRVADGVVPISVLEPLVEAQGCTLLRRNNPYCDPACQPGQTCDFDGQCIDWPLSQDLGTVELVGLNVALSMQPMVPGNTYSATSLSHPAADPGEALGLSMPDGVYGPAQLYGVAVEPLVVSDAGWTIAADQALAVSWVAPPAGARSEIVLTVQVDQHGVTPGQVRCVLPDTGSATVPADVVGAMVAAGVTGFPSGTLERRTADRVPAGAGCMDFQVRSPRAVPVDVVGHTPCVDDLDCPEGQDCDEELQTCR